MNCAYCDTEIVPSYYKKPDGFRAMKYTCSEACKIAKPKLDPPMLLDPGFRDPVSCSEPDDDWFGVDAKYTPENAKEYHYTFTLPGTYKVAKT